MFLAVTCQHASGACQSHSRPVLNLREASRKYVELSPSTPPFLTLQFYKKELTLTPNLLQISGRYSLRLGIFDTPSARAYSFSCSKMDNVQTLARACLCIPGCAGHINKNWSIKISPPDYSPPICMRELLF
jgi:hypothetical protein